MDSNQTQSVQSSNLVDLDAVYTARKYVTKESTVYFLRLEGNKYALLVPYLHGEALTIQNISWLFAWAVGCQKGSRDGQLFMIVDRDHIAENLRRFCFLIFGEHYTISHGIT